MSSSRTRSAVLLLGAGVALAACQPPPGSQAPCAVRFTIVPPAGTQFAAEQRPAVSPDGAYLASVAIDAGGGSRLWIQSLARPETKSLSGTDGAAFPFWSPDGQHLGFFAAERLVRIDREGAGARTLAAAPNGHGGSWGPDGTIIFSAGTAPSIFSVPAGGGAARQLTNIGDRPAGSDMWPVFLPDGKHFVYSSINEKDEGHLFLGSLRSAERDHVMGARSPVAYIQPGAFLFGWGSALLAHPFDLNVFQTYGQATVVAPSIVRGPSGLASFAASGDGSVMVYADAGSEMVWVDASGRETAAMPDAARHPRLSPSGRHILVTLRDTGLYAVYDTTDDRWLGGRGEGASPARWGPDGTSIVLTAMSGGRSRIVAMPVDGRVAPRTLFDEKGAFFSVATTSGRGGLLAVLENQTTAHRLLRIVTFAAAGSLSQRTIWQTSIAAPGGASAISPDGRWLAYTTYESGSEQLYVAALDAGASGARLAGPGSHPVWSGDGAQLFYKTERGIAAVSTQGAPPAWLARERLVIPATMLRDRLYDDDAFDVSRDGARVLLSKSARPGAPVALRGLRSCGAGFPALFPLSGVRP